MSADANDLNAFAARLATLQPTTGLSRDQMMFDAGRRSARRTSAWPFMSLALAGLALWFASRPATLVETVRLVERPRSAGDRHTEIDPPDTRLSYFRIRDSEGPFNVQPLPTSNVPLVPSTIWTAANLNDSFN